MIKLRSEKKLFWSLACSMAIVILASNYLVQFPVNRLGLNEILTYGAFSYPIAFLITDLANRKYGKLLARQIVYFGFIIGVFLTLFFSTNFSDLISIRIAIGSGAAFFHYAGSLTTPPCAEDVQCGVVASKYISRGVCDYFFPSK